MSLESLIAERDRIAEQLREANQRICDEFNTLYPVGTRMMHRIKGEVVLFTAARVEYDGKAIAWYDDGHNHCGADITSLQPIPQEAKT